MRYKRVLSALTGVIMGLGAMAQADIPADLPKQGTLTLKSGKYAVTLLPGAAFELSGFAFEGQELFASSTTSAGITLQPAGERKLTSIKLSVDDNEMPIRRGDFAGEKICLEREYEQSGYSFKNSYCLNKDGLEIKIAYTPISPEALKYFYLYTLPWSPRSFAYASIKDGHETSGEFKSTGEWLINGTPSVIGIYQQESSVGAVLCIPNMIPTWARQYSIWDHKTYRKLFIFHTPQKKSVEYTLLLKAFKSDSSGNWLNDFRKVVKTMPVEQATSAGRIANKIKVLQAGDVSKVDDWKINRRGIEALDPDFVLPPFTPVQATAKQASVWNRIYTPDQLGLLKSVTIAGKEEFAQPMTAELVANGKKLSFASSKTTLQENKKGRALYLTEAEHSLLSLSTKTTVEFDGMVRIDMTLSPKQKISLDSFNYAFHLPKEMALYLHFIGCPKSGSIMIPRESLTISVPQKEGTFFNEPFKILVWIGDNDKGFLWFSSSEQHFSPQEEEERPNALTASVQNGMVTFRVSPVTKSYIIEQPITYTFGFFATPVRPMPPHWRSWFYTTRRALYGSEKAHGHVGNMAMIWPDETRSTAAPRFSAESEAKMKKFTSELHASGKYALGYMDPIRVHMGYLKYLDTQPSRSQQLNDMFTAEKSEDDAFLYRVPEVRDNYEEWKTIPEVIYSYGTATGGRELRAAGESWTDFFCFIAECYAKLGYDGMGDIDNCFPIRSSNAKQGMGYTDQNGIRRCTWDWFQRRDMYKRMAAIFMKERGGKPGILTAHSSATWSIPFISFCDANMTFEHSNSGYFSSQSFLSKYNPHKQEIAEDMKSGGKHYLWLAFPPERWRGELTGRQFGIPAIIMANQTKSPQVDKAYAQTYELGREHAAFVAAHDTLMWPIWCDTTAMVQLQKIREEFGLGEEDVTYYPYWNENPLVHASNKETNVTVYARSGKIMVIASNLTDAPQEGVLNFNVKASFLNGETKEKLQLKENSLSYSLKARDYMIIIAELNK